MPKLRTRLAAIAPYAFFAAVCAVTLCMDVFVARRVLDGDTCANVLRGYIMARQGRLLPQHYAMTTELNPFGSSGIFALLFLVTDNWTVVRIVGTAILQALYAGSFCYLAAALHIPRKWCLFGCGLLLLPFSMAYARIALYHVYYTQYIAEAFVLLALFVRLSQKKRRVLHAALYALLWTLCGTNGVRTMMIFGAPLLLSILWLLLRAMKEITDKGGTALRRLRQTEAFAYLLRALAGFFCYLIGFVIYIKLSSGYDFRFRTNYVFDGSIQGDTLLLMLNNLLHAIGVRVSAQSLLGLRGISLVCAFGIVIIGYALSLRQKDLAQQMPAQQMMRTLPAAAMIFTLILLPLQQSQRPEEWYFVPPLAMLFPLLLLEWHEGVVCKKTGLLRRSAAVVMALMLLFQGVYSVDFLRSMGKNRMDRWTGLLLWTMNATEEVQPTLDYLDAHNETAVLMPYWYGSVATEMTDGRIMPAIYDYYDETFPLQYFRWGTYTEPWEANHRPETLVAMILKSNEALMRREHPTAELLQTNGTWQLWRMPTDEIIWE